MIHAAANSSFGIQRNQSLRRACAAARSRQLDAHERAVRVALCRFYIGIADGVPIYAGIDVPGLKTTALARAFQRCGGMCPILANAAMSARVSIDLH